MRLTDQNFLKVLITNMLDVVKIARKRNLFFGGRLMIEEAQCGSIQVNPEI
ncbi:MAG: hypothetical protein CM15mV73_190 [Caudoviricetes sp.]|nr:MAG: hypothetical protein CM15mV73_190 [Caudoviricetes sp.]